ncbi:hypothetical protein PVK06_009270 [Gossypium arboreum]|uniref:Uncharacterized protein n=1 Tax=Gossypium arboreum TaxID=29729 RepID=A0ABR0QM70_GOSAR|nr:hypothetical protein PVK06_009270 [Gossypium arboreum]
MGSAHNNFVKRDGPKKSWRKTSMKITKEPVFSYRCQLDILKEDNILEMEPLLTAMEWLKSCCVDIDKQHKDILVWVSLEEVPNFLWHEQFFKTLRSRWGSVIKLDDATKDKDCSEMAKCELEAQWIAEGTSQFSDDDRYPFTEGGKRSLTGRRAISLG